jgi:uncharacterized membrane protein YbaN (DUF454 family)
VTTHAIVGAVLSLIVAVPVVVLSVAHIAKRTDRADYE